MLIDTGFSTPFLDCGESLIAPFLWRNNINRLDMVVLTHPDADHCGGAPFLFKNFSVDRLILPDSAQMRPKFAPLIELASSRGAAVEFHNAGDVLVIAPKSHVEVLHPPAAVPPGQYSDNDLSLILKVTHHDLTMLFSGDATKETFGMMESGEISPTSMILKAPHHGLPSSYNRRFIGMVKPEFVIISGRAFRSNDSIKRRISRYRLLCPQVFSTEENGAIIIERDQEDFTVRACRGSG
jgi:competence protein ComEC